MNFSIKNMQLFISVMEIGNFSEIARREGLSPSSISRVIYQLEDEIGALLFYRNTRAILPTENGRILGESFKKILNELEETSQKIKDQTTVPAGLVRINAPVVFGQKHIAPWIAELCAKFPSLRIELTQTDDFVDPLTTNADLLFRIGPLGESVFHSRIVDHPVYHMAATKKYLDIHGVPKIPSDLLNHNCLVYKGAMGAQRAFFKTEGNKKEVLSLKGSLLSNNAETLVNAALNDAGVIMMADWQIGNSLQNSDLIRILPDYPVSNRDEDQVIAILYPHARLLPLSVRTVIDFYIEKFGEPVYWKWKDKSI
ncbi:LysR family transcriptional regulator [Pectobacterium carotovorum]|uniref:LysR family transcriptional regulator n=1 Tax=Pectobacterium carotovorum TaxID=554 RepID=UPI0010FD9972|nr:LysR family transcriptional regulator [Pectobacterium carotovorum]KAA3667353.1 LysR family transcriptional regulator [Pectobacterium carotovorum subsp. carotovorum]